MKLAFSLNLSDTISYDYTIIKFGDRDCKPGNKNKAYL